MSRGKKPPFVKDPVYPPCDFCGLRVYPIAWRAPDDIWKEVAGEEFDLLCVSCFTAFAEVAGIQLDWTAHRFELSDPTSWTIAEPIAGTRP